MRRPLVWILFATIFVAELSWSGIAPLLPSYQEAYGLTDVQTGLILTLSAVGILFVSVPAGALTRRIPIRTLTLAAVAALTAGNLLIGLSTTYPGLLLGRGVYGIGLGVMWVTGTAWLHDAARDDAPRALALTTAVVGAGALVGPAITGWLGEAFGLGVPFVLLGVATGLMLVVLLLVRSPEGRETDPGARVGEMLRAARADHLMLSALALTLAVSLMWMSVELLVPLSLDEDGLGAGQIGIVFSIASVVFVAASAVTSARAERWATVRVGAIWTGAYAACVLVPVFFEGVPATIAFLAMIGVTTGVMISLTYPLGALGARQGGFSVAIVGALLNIVWASSGLIGPTVGGAVAERVGPSAWYLLLTGVGVAAALWMWLRRDTVAAGDEVSART